MISTQPLKETDVTRRAKAPSPLRRRLASGGAMLAALALVTLVGAPPSFAAPTLNVSATENLTAGQTLTISGGGFKANLNSIAIGECIISYTGPADCNTSGGAQFKNADAQGNVSSFTIVVKPVFGKNDCSKVQCVIAGAPLPTNTDAETIKANTVVIPIYFGGPAPAAAPATTAATGDGAAAPVTGQSSMTMATSSAATVEGAVTPTGTNGSIGFLLLVGGAIIAGGLGIFLMGPATKRDKIGGTR